MEKSCFEFKAKYHFKCILTEYLEQNAKILNKRLKYWRKGEYKVNIWGNMKSNTEI